MLDPVTAGLILGGVGSILGARSSARTNRTNAQSVKDTNDANRTEARLNREFQVRQVASQREFDVKQTDKAYERSMSSVSDARNWDKAQIDDQRKFDLSVRDSAREYDQAQVIDQRNYNRDQVLDQRDFDVQQMLAAEARQRQYILEDREYSSPANVRARLEEAGFDPRYAMDASAGYFSGGTSGATSGIASSGAATSGLPSSSSASSGIATAIAARSGLASGSAANFIAHTAIPSPFGNSVSAIGGMLLDYQSQQDELAIRRSQVEMEHQRLNSVIQRSTLRPVVGGPYEQRRQNGAVPNSSDYSTVRTGNTVVNIDNERTGLDTGFGPTDIDTRWSDAELGETRWGEVGGSLYGLAVMGADIFKSVGPSVASWMTANGTPQRTLSENTTRAGRDWYERRTGDSRGVITRGGRLTPYGSTVRGFN